jgi:hypothetical protein
MQCPPGKIINPKTRRCVRTNGKIALGLLEEGYIRNVDLYDAVLRPVALRPVAPRPVAPRPVALRPVALRPVALHQATPRQIAFGPAVPIQMAPRPVAPVQMAPRPAIQSICPPGMIRSPYTRRCIKIGGPAYKKIYVEAPYVSETEPKFANPLGVSAPVPMAEKSEILKWLAENCKYTTDILTGRRFADDSTANLQSLVRLHDGVCVSAPSLHTEIAKQHKLGIIAALPYDRKTHVTLGDFKVLREVMRRTVPGYKIPPRAHQPPPSDWKLYVASDKNSGPDFVSVLYVDVTKAVRTMWGVEYPPESIRVDLGVLPITGNIHTFTVLLQRLDEMNRLLTPIAGGWKPLKGFPHKKSYWANNQTEKLKRLYNTMLESMNPMN